jgi:HEAT repeat protein
LQDFGAEAKVAVPALTQLLGDPNLFIAADVSNALLKIDTEAAAKAGVERER